MTDMWASTGHTEMVIFGANPGLLPTPVLLDSDVDVFGFPIARACPTTVASARMILHTHLAKGVDHA